MTTTIPQPYNTVEAGILSEYCHSHTGNDNGGWMCRQCHIEQGTVHILDLANARTQARDNAKVRESIEGDTFVAAMVKLGWIEDRYGVIDAVLDGLITIEEANQIEHGQQVWQPFETRQAVSA